MSAAETHAVFLSYASQDAEAATRICDALRATGVEVWFDQNELVGGDAWDAKIRGQIASCALFVPVISANTQARLEGYFRLEWKLAAQRTHTMAEEKAFLLPVLIDATRDAEAKVPAEFRAVQWTRLPNGETPPAFAARVSELLGGARGAERTFRSEAPACPGQKGNVTRTKSRRWLVPAGAGVAVVAGVAALAIGGPWRSAPGGSSTGAVVVPVATEARKFTLQARALIDDDPLAVRQNFLTAKRLGARAIELDPGDGEAYAVAARAACQLNEQYRDRSPASVALIRSYAESAIRLAPDSVDAGLAMAQVDLVLGDRPEDAYRRLERLQQRVPDDRRVLRRLQSTAAQLNRDAEVDKWIECAIRLPGGDADSLVFRGSRYWGANRYPEMAAVLERSLALRATTGAAHFKLMLQVWGWGDLVAGGEWVQQMPSSLLQEDRVAYLAYLAWYWSRDPDKALGILQRFPGAFIEQSQLFLSTAYLAGCAHRLAGRNHAAEIEFTAALKALDERLALEANNPTYVAERARVLVCLNRLPEAREAARTYQELIRSTEKSRLRSELLLLVATTDEALAILERSIEPSQSRWPIRVNELRYDPVYDPLRSGSRFQALVARGEAQLAQLREGKLPAK